MLIQHEFLQGAPQQILSRAYSYFKTGAVKSIDESDDRIFASVQGSKTKPYNVQIQLDDNNCPQMAWCNCPYGSRRGDYCKHIYAVLIYYFTHIKKGDVAPTNPIIQEPEFKPASTVMLTDKQGRDNNFVSVVETIDANLSLSLSQTKRDDGKKGRLVFVIEDSSSYYSSKSHWSIHAAAQYLKKNGEPGRVEKFRDYKITEKFTKDEFVFLHKLMNNREERAPLSLHLGYLLKKQLPNIYVNAQFGIIPASFEEIQKTEISFRIAGILNNSYVFKPVFKVIGEKGNTIKLFSNDQVDCDGFLILSIGENGVVYYKEDDELFYSIFKTIFQRSLTWTFPDIKKLKEYFNSRYLDKVKITFDATSVKLVHPVPKVILNLSKEFSYNCQTRAYLFFDYLGREISLMDPPDLLILNEDGDHHLLAQRNKEYEKKICKYLSTLDCFKEHGKAYYSWQEDRKFISSLELNDFLTKHGCELIDNGIELRIHGQKERLNKRGKISIVVSSKIDWFDVKAEYVDEKGNKADIQINEAMLENAVVKTGGSLTIINKESIDKLQRFIKYGMSSDGKLKISKFNFHLIDELYHEVSNKTELNVAKNISEQLKSFSSIENQTMPLGFNGKLRDYQSAGYNWLYFLRKYNLSGCLADDMGLGKTVQTLAFLQSLKEKGNLKTSLIVVPVNVIANWESEIKSFTPDIKYLLHVGSGRTKYIENLKNFELIIVSYQTLRSDIELFEKINYDYLILDESQNIKNFNSLTHKAVKILKSTYRLSLTGTPVENNTLELWSQMEFLVPSLLGTARDFKKNYATPIEVYKDEEVTNRLKKTIFPFILRRKKEDVAKDLPKKSELTLYSEMGHKQSEIYEQYKEFYKQQIIKKLEEEGPKKIAIEVFAALLKLRQVALFPSLADKKYENVESCKFELFKDTIEEILEEGHKIVVFSQFVGSLKIIERYCSSKKTKFSYIDGSVSAEKRKEQINNFQSNEDIKLFLLSLKAGGVGINLTAAGYSILFDPWWNPAVEAQAVDRIHRIGQTKKVIVYKMITKGTVEEKILELQEKKKELVKNLVANESSFYKSLTKKDIIALFG